MNPSSFSDLPLHFLPPSLSSNPQSPPTYLPHWEKKTPTWHCISSSEAGSGLILRPAGRVVTAFESLALFLPLSFFSLVETSKKKKTSFCHAAKTRRPCSFCAALLRYAEEENIHFLGSLGHIPAIRTRGTCADEGISRSALHSGCG